MSLLFGGATSDRVNCGHGSSIANLAAYTMLYLVYPTNTTGSTKLFSKGEGAHNSHAFRFDGTSAGACEYFRGYSTTDVDYSWASTGINAINKWYWIVLTFDGAASPPIRLYTALLGANLSEETNTNFTAGPSGTRFDDSANDYFIGNRGSATFNQAWKGNIACDLWYNSVLPIGVCNGLIHDPRRLAGMAGYWQLGFNGTGTQPDWSGNGNAGTVTGATVAAHAPLVHPFGRRRAWHSSPAVAAPPAAGGQMKRIFPLDGLGTYFRSEGA